MFFLLLVVGARSTLADEPSPTLRRPPITAIALNPANDELVAGSQAGLQRFSWPELAPLGRIETTLAQIHDLAFRTDGRHLLVAGGTPAESGDVQMLDWPQATIQRSLRVADEVIYRVRYSSDERTIATACGDGTCRVLDSQSGEERLIYRGHSRSVLALASLEGHDPLWVSGGVDVTLRIWNGTTGVTSRTLDNHVAAIHHVAVRPRAGGALNGEPPVWIASLGDDRTVRLWQPLIGRLVRFTKLPSAPRAMAWSGDGMRLFVACNDGAVRELDFDTLEVARTWSGEVGRPHDLLLDRESRHLVVAGERGLRVTKLTPP